MLRRPSAHPDLSEKLWRKFGFWTGATVAFLLGLAIGALVIHLTCN
jgi:hypothetical protein